MGSRSVPLHYPHLHLLLCSYTCQLVSLLGGEGIALHWTQQRPPRQRLLDSNQRQIQQRRGLGTIPGYTHDLLSCNISFCTALHRIVLFYDRPLPRCLVMSTVIATLLSFRGLLLYAAVILVVCALLHRVPCVAPESLLLVTVSK